MQGTGIPLRLEVYFARHAGHDVPTARGVLAIGLVMNPFEKALRHMSSPEGMSQ